MLIKFSVVSFQSCDTKQQSEVKTRAQRGKGCDTQSEELLGFGRAQEIDEQAIGAGDPFRKLAEEGKAGVDVNTFAEMGVNESAIERGLARIIHGEQGSVARIEIAPEIEAALLKPIVEIGLCDLVGVIEQRIVWLEKCYVRVFVGNAREG